MSNIKKIRQADIVHKTGFDRSQVSRWLQGISTPNLKTAIYISQQCGVPVDIFTSRAAQMLHFGKVFLKHDVTYEKQDYSNRKKRKKDDEVA